ncbi:MAG: DNA translocase FtsK [Verrucomicrobia bacterium]|nr:DNA translocase FtsK [Verrucomicrobiota bacterium]
MARKDQGGRQVSRGGNDILGILLVSAAMLLFAALFSFDKYDLPANREPPNQPAHNWIGRFGASAANGLFFVCGAAAYLFPVLLLGFGFAYVFTTMSYLRRRWPWALVLTLTCTAALDLATDPQALEQLARQRPGSGAGYIEQLTLEMSAPSAGGVVGLRLNRHVFDWFGDVGAGIIFATLYLISLYGLTNFHLGDWVRGVLARRGAAARSEAPWLGDEKAMDRRARDLEREARRLQSEVDRAHRKSGSARPTETVTREGERSGLGADLRPVPEPTVRDLSVPQVGPAGSGKVAAGKAAAPTEGPEDPAIGVGEVISAREIVAATAAEVSDSSSAPVGPGLKGEEIAAGEEVAGGGEGAVGAPPPAPPRPKPAPRKPKPIAVAAPPQIGNYELPSLELLNLPDLTFKPTESKEELMANARLMQQTLAQFDIEVSLGDITKGPTITRYELHPAPGVKLERITGLTNNIAAALKAERIHILAPVPGKSSVGVEVPNVVKSKVILRELLESEEWRQSKGRIPLALGKDVYGHPIVVDLAEMPHLLIAGSTGSGKSVCINAIVASLLYRFPPDLLRFVMIDPKVVELQQYNALPHLVVPVVTDPRKVLLALRWVVSEMEKRYQIFARVGVRNIRSFNERPKNKPLPPRELELLLTSQKEKIEAGLEGFAVEVDEEIVVPRDEDMVIPDKLSYIVVIIDELADLMLVTPADVEMAIARITQMARAAGIHCIVATQRPSVDVITGVIKANIPCRIAFQVAAKVDSRTILDAMGADKLLGKGDMLYLPPGSAKLIRAQGALVTDQEIQSVVDFIMRQGKPSYEMEIHQQLARLVGGGDEEEGIDEDEELIEQCIEVIRSEQKASVSLLQRRLRLGYTRAARIMDELENRGLVGPSKGAEPRDILIDLDGEGADGQGQRYV